MRIKSLDKYAPMMLPGPEPIKNQSAFVVNGFIFHIGQS